MMQRSACSSGTKISNQTHARLGALYSGKAIGKFVLSWSEELNATRGASNNRFSSKCIDNICKILVGYSIP